MNRGASSSATSDGNGTILLPFSLVDLVVNTSYTNRCEVKLIILLPSVVGTEYVAQLAIYGPK